jgi:hypothetical protein
MATNPLLAELNNLSPAAKSALVRLSQRQVGRDVGNHSPVVSKIARAGPPKGLLQALRRNNSRP